MGLSCQKVFRADPLFSVNNTNGSFFVAIESAEFWKYIDNATQGDCNFAVLSQTRTLDDLITQYDLATLACFAFVIVSVIFSLWTGVHNFVNYNRKRLATFYEFSRYIIEDMSQLCIQIFILSYQIMIRCWLCATENGCTSACNGRPTAPQVPTLSSFAELDTSINKTMILLSITMAGMLFNGVVLTLKGLYNVRRHKKFLLFGILLSPFIILGLLTPLAWASWFALLPVLDVSGVSSTVCLAAAIIGSVSFPFVFVGMFYHFLHHSKHDNRIRKGTQTSQATIAGVIEMTPLPGGGGGEGEGGEGAF